VAPSSREPLRVERQGDIALWTLDRPEAKNALDFATFASLSRAIAAASGSSGLRAVVLTGAGGTFASGGDLRELRSALGPEDAARLADAGRAVCDGLAELTVPVIAALPGPAIGGGAELAMACDLRVADPRASICFKHARMGVTSAWGVLPKLAAVVGHATASRLLLTAQTLSAEDAARAGLFDAISAEGECVPAAVSWALDVVQGAPDAIRELKSLLREAVAAVPALRASERARFVASWTSDDHREAVEAYFAGRPPVWKPR
jgi:enoyl-CoA hydratase